MKNKRFFVIVSSVVLLVLLLFAVFQFSDNVNWTLEDYFAAGFLFLGTALSIDFVVRKVRKAEYRVVLCMAILALLFLIWAELAVGII